MIVARYGKDWPVDPFSPLISMIADQGTVLHGDAKFDVVPGRAFSGSLYHCRWSSIRGSIPVDLLYYNDDEHPDTVENVDSSYIREAVRPSFLFASYFPPRPNSCCDKIGYCWAWAHNQLPGLFCGWRKSYSVVQFVKEQTVHIFCFTSCFCWPLPFFAVVVSLGFFVPSFASCHQFNPMGEGLARRRNRMWWIQEKKEKRLMLFSHLSVAAQWVGKDPFAKENSSK